MNFGELKKAIAEAEQNGLSEHAPVYVVDNTNTGDQFHIEEALNDVVHSADTDGNPTQKAVFWIGLALIMHDNKD